MHCTYICDIDASNAVRSYKIVTVYTNFRFLSFTICKLNSKKIAFFSGLPDPFARIAVDGSGQCHSTDIIKHTLDPKWNQNYDL